MNLYGRAERAAAVIDVGAPDGQAGFGFQRESKRFGQRRAGRAEGFARADACDDKLPIGISDDEIAWFWYSVHDLEILYG
jgi:hypothetical protein